MPTLPPPPVSPPAPDTAAPPARRFPDDTWEAAAQRRGARVIVGIDEVGRGPWAGPVVACAARVIGPVPERLDDSKKLSAKRREAMRPLLVQCCQHAYGEATPQEIDALNIRRATHLAMRRAVMAFEAEHAVAVDHFLIDGRDRPEFLTEARWAGRGHDLIVRGDSASLSIAAASVLAKTWRDRGMMALAQQHPGYGWERNMGYGTREHRDGLKCHGVTPHHRQSFRPIHNML